MYTNRISVSERYIVLLSSFEFLCWELLSAKYTQHTLLLLHFEWPRFFGFKSMQCIHNKQTQTLTERKRDTHIHEMHSFTRATCTYFTKDETKIHQSSLYTKFAVKISSDARPLNYTCDVNVFTFRRICPPFETQTRRDLWHAMLWIFTPQQQKMKYFQ